MKYINTLNQFDGSISLNFALKPLRVFSMINEWGSREDKNPISFSHFQSITLIKGEGSWVWDKDGKRYLDMSTSCSATVYGHCHPRILSAFIYQASRLSLCPSHTFSEHWEPYTRKLRSLFKAEIAIPIKSEEAAFRILIKAIQDWGHENKGISKRKIEIILFNKGLYGYLTSIKDFSFKGQKKDSEDEYLPHFHLASFGNIEALKKIVNQNSCAIITEAFYEEDGVIIPPKGWLKDVEQICKDNNLLLISNECRTELGRTGKLLSFYHDEIQPHGIVLGNALGGGVLSSAALLGTSDLLLKSSLDLNNPLYENSPLKLSLGLASLHVLIEEKLIDHSADLGRYFLNRLRQIESPYLQDVRGEGLWIGIELDANYRTNHSVCEQLAHMGILTKPINESVIHLAPSLVITQKEIDWALIRIHQVLVGCGTFAIQVPLAF